MTTIADFSQVQQLAARLAAAPARMESETSKVIDEVAAAVVSDARAGVPVDTGALRESIEVRRSGSSGRRERYIFSDERQGYFLEYGSPTTGGPIPWLSGPADRGSVVLHDELARAADPL